MPTFEFKPSDFAGKPWKIGKTLNLEWIRNHYMHLPLYCLSIYRLSMFCNNFRCRDEPCEGNDEHVTKDIIELMNDSKEAYTTWQQGSKLKLTAMTTQVSIYNNSIERLHGCGAFWHPHMTGFFSWELSH